LLEFLELVSEPECLVLVLFADGDGSAEFLSEISNFPFYFKVMQTHWNKNAPVITIIMQQAIGKQVLLIGLSSFMYLKNTQKQ
jgi:hypothetical protein